MVEFGKYLLRNRVQEWSAHYVRYEELKKCLKKLQAARAARIAAEAACTGPETEPTDDVEIEILNHTEPPVTAQRSPRTTIDHETMLTRGPGTAAEEKPMGSLLTCLEPESEAATAASAAAAASAGSPRTMLPLAVLAAAAHHEHQCEEKFLLMMDEDARTVDGWFRSQKRYLREQLAILEQQSRELKAQDEAEKRRLKEFKQKEKAQQRLQEHQQPSAAAAALAAARAARSSTPNEHQSPSPTPSPTSSASPSPDDSTPLMGGSNRVDGGMRPDSALDSLAMTTAAAADGGDPGNFTLPPSAATRRARNRMHDGQSASDQADDASSDAASPQSRSKHRRMLDPLEEGDESESAAEESALGARHMSPQEARAAARAALMQDDSDVSAEPVLDSHPAVAASTPRGSHTRSRSRTLSRGGGYTASMPVPPPTPSHRLRRRLNEEGETSDVGGDGDAEEAGPIETEETRAEAMELAAFDAKLRAIQDARDAELAAQMTPQEPVMSSPDSALSGVDASPSTSPGVLSLLGESPPPPVLLTPFSSLVPRRVNRMGSVTGSPQTPSRGEGGADADAADGPLDGHHVRNPDFSSAVAAPSADSSQHYLARRGAVPPFKLPNSGSAASLALSHHSTASSAGAAAVSGGATSDSSGRPRPPQRPGSHPSSSGKDTPEILRKGTQFITAAAQQIQSLATQSLHESVHGVETIHVHARLRMRLLSSRKPWDTLRVAFKELYRGIQLLRDFKMHNYTAFVKILKKHDKVSPNQQLHSKCMHVINSMHVFASNELHHLQLQVEQVFARDFSFDTRKEALNVLKPVHTPMSHLVTFRLGLLLGLSLALTMVLGVLLHFVSIRTGAQVSVRLKPVLPIYRGLFLVILHLWLWGANVYLFKKTRINYQFIFEIDPKTELEGPQVLQAASVLTFLWFLSLDLYLATELLKDFWPNLVPGYFHLALYVLVFLGTFCPFNILARGTRLYIAQTLWHIVTTGWGPVAFRDFYTCNQLCSLVNVLNDLSYGMCFYASGDFTNESTSFCKDFSSETQWIISLLPYWFRFLQCLKRWRDSGASRQLMNAGKYALSLNTTMWSSMNKHFPEGGAFVAPWVLCAVVSTVASYSWDVKSDWGLMQFKRLPREEKHSFAARCHAFFLRPRRVLRSTIPYYFAIVTDCVFRLAWVATISTPDSFAHATGIPADYFKSIIYCMEILRRNQWNFYRLENEHWANVDKEKVFNIVALKPRKGDGHAQTKAEAEAEAVAAAEAHAQGISSDSAAPNMPAARPQSHPNDPSQRRKVMCPTGVVACAEGTLRFVSLQLRACASCWSECGARCRGHKPSQGKSRPTQVHIDDDVHGVSDTDDTPHPL